MTFNSSQQERLLAALERIADALENAADLTPAERLASHRRNTPTIDRGDPADTDPQTTKGPYR